MTDGLPRISVSLSSGPTPNTIESMIERARAAHQAGLAALTLGDHHDMGTPYAQNTPMLGRLLAEWPGRPAGCLFLVPLWPPLLMAEHIATLAAIHQVAAPGERFIVQTGIGYGAAQFANLGADPRTRGKHLDAAIPAVRALLAGESVDDEFLGLSGARVGLCPEVDYDWWIGGSATAAIDRAARLGDAWYVGPGGSDAALASDIERYRGAGGERVMLRADAVLAPTAEAARAAAEQIAGRGYRAMTADQLLSGSVDQVAQRARELASLGVDEVVIRCAGDQAQAAQTLALLGELA